MEKRLNKLSKWGVVLVNIALYIASYKVYVLIHDKGVNPYIIYVLLILMIVEVVVQLLKYTQQQWAKHVPKETKDESRMEWPGSTSLWFSQVQWLHFCFPLNCRKICDD